ncbi:helix-turn-helix domain-containing protein [Paenibacillus sp. HJGM_3]|uniref:helix-turn-helix domain-containing protein n=1 Tax=Paenibacillus sp. HJGM_3 TaxID=3379816 RepID=UPI00385EA681
MLQHLLNIFHDGYALIVLPLSHQEIASMLGASQEAVSGVMSKLAKEGVVKTSRMSVQLALTILEENIPRNSTH